MNTRAVNMIIHVLLLFRNASLHGSGPVPGTGCSKAPFALGFVGRYGILTIPGAWVVGVRETAPVNGQDRSTLQGKERAK